MVTLYGTATDLPPLGINGLDICRVHDLRQSRVKRTQLAGDLAGELSVGQHVFGTGVVRNTGNEN